MIYFVCGLGLNLIAFIGFIGGFVHSTLGFIIPILLNISYFRNKGELDIRTYKIYVIIFILAVTLAVLATFQSGLSLFSDNKP